MPVSDAAAHAASRSAECGWWPALSGIGLGVSAMLIAHHATVGEAVSVWSRSLTYSYAWLVLPTLCYLVWHNRGRLASLAPSGSIAGILAAAACAALWIAGDLLNIAAGRQLALVAAIAAVVLAAVGWPAFRVLAPFVAFLAFLVPTGTFLLPLLKHLAVDAVEGLAVLSGMPFASDGFAIHIGPRRYVVIDACAGLFYVLTGLFLGATLALLIYRSWWRIVALTLFGGGLAVVANGLRIGGIVAYDYATGSQMELSEHTFFEWPAVALCFAALFFVFSRLTPEPAADGVPSGAIRTAPAHGAIRRCVVPALLAAAPVAAASMLPHGPPAAGDVEAAAGMLPVDLAGWTRRPHDTGWRPHAPLKAGTAALATYMRGDRKISVFVAHTASRREKIGGAGLDLVGGPAWMSGRQETLPACIGEVCYEVRHTTLLLRGSSRVRHVYSVYAVGALTTASPFRLRLYRAWAGLARAPAPARVVAIATEEAGGLPAGDIAALVRMLATPRPPPAAV